MTAATTQSISEVDVEPVTEVNKSTIESLKEQKHLIGEHWELVDNFSERVETVAVPTPTGVQATHNVTLPDGEELSAPDKTDLLNQVLSRIEAKTVQAGESLLQVVEQNGFPEEDITAQWEDRTAGNLARIEGAETVLNGATHKFYEALPREMSILSKEGKRPAEFFPVGLQIFERKGDDEGYAALEEAYTQYSARAQELQSLKSEVREEISDMSKKMAEVSKPHIDSIKQVLSQVRPFGSKGSLTVDAATSKAALASVNAAAQLFPTDWVNRSDNHARMVVKASTRRAHYSPWMTQKYSYSHSRIETGAVKEKSFVPSAEDRRLGIWIKAENGITTDPYSGATQEAHWAGDDQSAWAVYEAETFTPRRHSSRLDKTTGDRIPRGSGWVKEQVLNDSGETVTEWRRPRQFTSKGTRYTPELLVGKDISAYDVTPGFQVAAHELSHRMEDVHPRIQLLESKFLQRRTTNADGEREPLVRMVDTVKGRSSYTSKEVTRPDGFANAYIGKEYRDGMREVLSMGMESVFAGANGSLMGVGGFRKDRDMKAFILGMLATT